MTADLVTSEINVYPISGRREKVDLSKVSDQHHGGGDNRIVDYLALSMKTGEKPLASGHEGFTSAIVCLACDEARLTNQVIDVEKYWQQFGF